MSGRSGKYVLLSGVRGTGKTSLLTEMADIVKAEGWVTMVFEGDSGNDDWFADSPSSRLAAALEEMDRTSGFADSLSKYVSAALPAIAQILGLPISAAQTAPSTPADSMSTTEVIVQMGQSASQSGTGI